MIFNKEWLEILSLVVNLVYITGSIIAGVYCFIKKVTPYFFEKKQLKWVVRPTFTNPLIQQKPHISAWLLFYNSNS